MPYLRLLTFGLLLFVPWEARAFYITVNTQVCALGDTEHLQQIFIDHEPITSYSFDFGTVPCATGTAASAGALNLGTGMMSISSESTQGTVAGGSIAMGDELTFSVAGGGSAVVTANLLITGSTCAGIPSPCGSINSGTQPLWITFGETDSVSLHDFVSPTLLSSSWTVSDGETVNILAGMYAATAPFFGGASVDLHAKITLDLPTGVTFESASGVFLDGVPVPTLPPLGVPMLAVLLSFVGGIATRLRRQHWR